MERNRIRYKDCIIEPCPLKAQEDKGWVPEAQVEYHYGAGVEVTPLHSNKILSSEEEAKKYSIGMARQWIDKKYY